jgi:hypothetical protein
LAPSALGEKKESAAFAAKLDFQAVTEPKALGDTRAMSAQWDPQALLAPQAPQEPRASKAK